MRYWLHILARHKQSIPYLRTRRGYWGLEPIGWSLPKYEWIDSYGKNNEFSKINCGKRRNFINLKRFISVELCDPLPTLPANIQNLNPKATYKEGEAENMICQEEYIWSDISTGSKNLACDSNGKWNSISATCISMRPCAIFLINLIVQKSPIINFELGCLKWVGIPADVEYMKIIYHFDIAPLFPTKSNPLIFH